MPDSFVAHPRFAGRLREAAHRSETAQQINALFAGAVALARNAVDAGSGATMMFNAANEIAGQLFMQSRIGFYEISDVIAEGLSCDTGRFDVGLDDLMAADIEAKKLAAQIADRLLAARS